MCHSGEGHLHSHRAVLNRKWPAHSNNEGQEERNTTTLQAPDRRAVCWHQNVEEEQESKVKKHISELYQRSFGEMEERAKAHTKKQRKTSSQIKLATTGTGSNVQ